MGPKLDSCRRDWARRFVSLQYEDVSTYVLGSLEYQVVDWTRLH